MKYSAVAVSALVVAVAAKPQFLNSSFEVTEGKPFTLKYSGCDSGCTISLQDGPSSDLKEVKTLTSDASGSSTEVTLTGVPSGSYAFKIVDNSNEDDYNYSTQFPYKGTGSTSSSATDASTTASSTESSTATSTTETSSTTSSSSSATTPTSSSTSSTSSSSTSTSAQSTGTGAPDSGAVRIDSSFALIAGAVAAMAYIN